MCVVSSDKGQYEFIVIDDENDEVIISFKCASISTVARLLDEFNFARARVSVVRCSDGLVIDHDMILSIWRSKEVE